MVGSTARTAYLWGMIRIEQYLPNEEATTAIGEKLGRILRRGDIVCLTGSLGAGKTTLARAAIAAATGATEAPSPTFALVETHPAEDFTIYHFDLYRLETANDVWELGLEDALEDEICLIEWPEKIEQLLPENLLVIALSAENTGRKISIIANEEWSARLPFLPSHSLGIV